MLDMSDTQQWTMVHSRVVSAAAADVYRLIADVTRWPAIFESCIHVQHLHRGEGAERFRQWAVVNGHVKSWTSRRTLDPAGLRIGFEREADQPPIASTGGEWTFRSLAGGRTEIVLEHHLGAVGGRQHSPAISAVVEGNSEQELAALARVAEQPHPVDDVVFSFADSMRLDVEAAQAYTFVSESDRWPDRLPHVRRVELQEGPSGVQDMVMDTVTRDGHTHTTRSIRLCFPTTRIVYKQLLPPALLIGHSGAWDFVETPGGARATATHTVAINTTRIGDLLGSGSTVADAQKYLRDVLGTNSRITLVTAAAAGTGERSTR
jgi:aromatase